MRNILNDCKKVFYQPRKLFKELLELETSFISPKILFFIFAIILFLLLLPSTLIFLLILVIPFVLIMIGFNYFLAQELMLIYSDYHHRILDDFFYYRFAYMLVLASLPYAALNLVLNLFFIFSTGNIVAASVMSALCNVFSLVIYFIYVKIIMDYISKSEHGILKFIELACLSFISSIKAKLGFSAFEEIREDMRSLKESGS